MLLFLIEASSVYPRTDCLPCLGIAQVCLALCQATVCCGLCVECTQIQFKTPHPCPHTHHPIFLQSPAQSQSMFRVFKQIQKRPVNPLLVYRPLKKHRHHALSIKNKTLVPHSNGQTNRPNSRPIPMQATLASSHSSSPKYGACFCAH